MGITNHEYRIMNAEGRRPLLRHWLFVIRYLMFIVLANVALSAESASPRRIIDLNGTWEIAEGGMDAIPASFAHKVPVPGLVDMAEPAFVEVGKKSERRQAFWYRRTFVVDTSIPDVAMLKIHKARYGTKVWLNGKVVGEQVGVTGDLQIAAVVSHTA